MAFKYLDEEIIKKMIISLIQPKLEYAAVIWSPHKKKDIRKIEIIKNYYKNGSNSEKFTVWRQTFSAETPNSWEKKRKGRLIAVYRASLIDMICLCVTTELQEDTKRNWKGLHARETKKYSFPYRSIEALNKLDAKVINARNIHKLKNRLDNSRFGDRIVPALLFFLYVTTR